MVDNWFQRQYNKLDQLAKGYLPGGLTPAQIQAEREELDRLKAESDELDRLQNIQDYNKLTPEQQRMNYDPNQGREVVETVTPTAQDTPAPIQYAQNVLTDTQKLLLETSGSSYEVAKVTGNALAAIPEYVGDKTTEVLEYVPALAETKTESVSLPYQERGTQYYDPSKGFYTPTAFEVELPSIAQTTGKLVTNVPYVIPFLGESIIASQGVKVIANPNASLLQKGLGVTAIGLAGYGLSSLGRNLVLAENIAQSTTKFGAQVSEGELGTTARVISQTKVGPTTYVGFIKEGSINVGKDVTVGSSRGLIIKDVKKVVPIDFISSRVQPYKDYFVSKTGGNYKVVTTQNGLSVGKDFGEGVASISKVKLIDGGYDTTKTIGGFKKSGNNLYSFRGGDKPATTFGKDTLFGSLTTRKNIEGLVQVIPKKDVVYYIGDKVDDIYTLSLRSVKQNALKDKIIPTLTGTSTIGRYEPQQFLTYGVGQIKAPATIFDRVTQESIIGQVGSQRGAALEFARQGFKSTDQYLFTGTKGGASLLSINNEPYKINTKVDNIFSFKSKVDDIITLKPKIDVIQIYKPRVDERIKNDIYIGQIFKPKVEERIKNDIDVIQIYKPRTDEIIKTKVDQITKITTKPDVTQRFRPLTVTIRQKYYPRFVPPALSYALMKTKGSNVFKIKNNKKKKTIGGFDVQIKRKGKWISKGVSFTERQAGLFAQRSLKESLAASARLVPTTRKLQQSNIMFSSKKGEFRQYQISKGQKIFDPRLFIQAVGSKKQGFSRLGTRSEVREIMSYPKSKKKSKGGFWK